MQLNWVFLLGSSLASLAACQGGPLTSPPREPARFAGPWRFGPFDDGFQVLTNNERYRHGETIKVTLLGGSDTIENVTAAQLNTAKSEFGPKTDTLRLPKEGNTYLWTAQYDINHYLKNGEDAVYRFQFQVSELFGRPVYEKSAYFNVSMPDSSKKRLPAASGTPSLVRKSPTSQSTKKPQPDPTATAKPSRKNRKTRKKVKPSIKSGLTGPQVAGIAIGAVAAFVLTLLGFCWGYNRIRVARQLQKSHEFELRNMEREVRTLKDTVSKLSS
ncbi:uncharacterized protein FFB20_00059 [Fusarium fujikuroi]|uniref:Uncharacterized protein n=1 Tax=Gibberella fujikuroi (strain CBS 195.34 / IMI 58289 / NRRL A-6831) TaxID=1279085 RepID=S0E6F4_GIBF5|nr:uncharacterized protein FFUJ_06877 [Fusarium fujikuroi IMI 58289]KLO89173.1 uncharacterized protein LW93_12594 [Fusarium fujikuroi]KLP04388.1 uncharacterized protein Y057_7700 [Fusarium fujikuroi]KLP23069.1 uncharacterized protein LW94_2117 [Fusarium fujikuroi]CCT68113.1 uncharacterized protein FFUJ_06877 [Fusarium fujikuroi IMI 58289]SCN63842.1 uncharacterized protein FFB20_00059 [Fusarium fujikuroi]